MQNGEKRNEASFSSISQTSF